MGSVVITSASHAESREFEPRLNLLSFYGALHRFLNLECDYNSPHSQTHISMNVLVLTMFLIYIITIHSECFSSLQLHKYMQSGTVINFLGYWPESTFTLDSFALRRRNCLSSSWIGRLSVLPVVMAKHTIEMIPKSMILINFTSRSP